MGLPGAWTVLLLRAVVVHPAGSGFPSPYWRGNRRGLQAKRHPQHPGRHNFRGCFPTAHTLACLRVARRVAAAGARLTTGWAGSPFAGRGSHPLDDEPNFTRSSHLTPFGPASPGRTEFAIRSAGQLRWRCPTVTDRRAQAVDSHRCPWAGWARDRGRRSPAAPDRAWAGALPGPRRRNLRRNPRERPTHKPESERAVDTWRHAIAVG